MIVGRKPKRNDLPVNKEEFGKSKAKGQPNTFRQAQSWLSTSSKTGEPGGIFNQIFFMKIVCPPVTQVLAEKVYLVC